MTSINVINTCEVCGNSDLHQVLELGEHPLCDDLKSIGTEDECKLYPITILFCPNCKTAHQKYQVPKEDLFTKEYHYRARFTKDVLLGMKDLVNSSKSLIGCLNGKKVLDIGCNDGSLLNFFKDEGAFCIGVEPTNAILDVSQSVDAAINEYFDKNVAERILENFGSPDVITFTNVFAHIEDLHGLIQALKILISDDTHLIIENHYLGKVLETNQFDTFYHEHPRTYSATSFKYIADKLGMKIEMIEFPGRYGGNIRVSMKKSQLDSSESNFNEIYSKEEEYVNQFANMSSFIAEWKTTKLQELYDLKIKYKTLYAKAFPGRAAILIRLLGIDEQVFSGVFEQDTSKKVGHFVPGTKIPILQDSDMSNLNPKVLINLAWHIKAEIETYLRGNDFVGEIRHII